MLSKAKNVRHTRTLVNRCCNCQSVCIVSIYICYAFPQINQIAFSSRSQMAVVFIQRKWYIKTVEMINLARALRGTFSHITLHKEKRRNGFYVHHMKVHQKFNCNQLINFSKSNRKNANILIVWDKKHLWLTAWDKKRVWLTFLNWLTVYQLKLRQNETWDWLHCVWNEMIISWKLDRNHLWNISLCLNWTWDKVDFFIISLYVLLNGIK